MTVKEIVKEYLKKNGYDGLYNDNCGCKITEDLCPCDDWFSPYCEAGYLIEYKDGEECSCGEDCDWHIGPKKAEVEDGD